MMSMSYLEQWHHVYLNLQLTCTNAWFDHSFPLFRQRNTIVQTKQKAIQTSVRPSVHSLFGLHPTVQWLQAPVTRGQRLVGVVRGVYIFHKYKYKRKHVFPSYCPHQRELCLCIPRQDLLMEEERIVRSLVLERVISS